jgi:hypothetical protein
MSLKKAGKWIKKEVLAPVSNAVSNVGKFVGNIVDDIPVVGNLAEKIVTGVANTAANIIKDPMPVIETIALTMVGVPPPIANAAVTAMRGGNMKDIVISAGTAYVGGSAGRLAGSAAASAGASSAIAQIAAGAAGASSAGVTASLARGDSFEDALLNGLTAGAFGGVNSAVNMAVNSGLNAAATAANTPTPNSDNLNISPLSFDGAQPDITPTTDYSVNADYSFGSTPKLGIDPSTGTGFTASPLTSGAEYVGYSPVNYGLVGATPSLGLQMPTSPAIKAMGGGQGLTADVTNPVTGETGVVGGLGFTPTGAAPVLGDPSSFINNPDVTGSPVMAVDPDYYKTNLPKVSVSLGPEVGTAPSGGGSTQPTSQSSPLQSSPLQAVGNSYLTTSGATDAFELDKLKQLFPTLTPDMSKILMERVGVTPSMLSSQQGNFNDAPKVSFQDNFSPQEFADFGQPTYARGGNVKMPAGHNPEFITGQTGHYAQGRGTGQSDDIPAVLHDGDYVMDADTVAAFGDGSSKAGAGALEQFRRSIPVRYSGGGQPIPAKIADGEYVLPQAFVTSLGRGSNKKGAMMLDAMREKIRAHKRSAPDTKIPPKAKSPLQYMHEAMKG